MILLLLAASVATLPYSPPTEPAAARSLAIYQARIAAVMDCHAARSRDEILVCARRRADHFRVPLIEHDPGDPRYLPVMAQRQLLLHRTTPYQERSPFLVGGGMAGVTASSAHGVRFVGERPLAP